MGERHRWGGFTTYYYIDGSMIVIGNSSHLWVDPFLTKSRPRSLRPQSSHIALPSQPLSQNRDALQCNRQSKPSHVPTMKPQSLPRSRVSPLPTKCLNYAGTLSVWGCLIGFVLGVSKAWQTSNNAGKPDGVRGSCRKKPGMSERGRPSHWRHLAVEESVPSKCRS